MKRMALATVTFVIAVVTVALVTAGCSGTELETTAGPATARVAAANPCAAKNPCSATNPCAPKANPCAAKGENPRSANPCAPKR
jgi:hypothetical protein